MTPIYVQYDKVERRITASLYIASYMAINDSEIGRHEALVAEIESDTEIDDDERARRLAWLDENPFQYESGDDDDDIYEDMTGERVPKGMYVYMYEGDLFIGAHEDCDDWADEAARTDAWDALKATLLDCGFAAEWLHGDEAID